MQNTKEKIKCPICKGTGELEEPKNWPEQLARTQLKRKAAKLLKANHYSIRQIMRIMDYKSVSPVQQLLK